MDEFEFLKGNVVLHSLFFMCIAIYKGSSNFLILNNNLYLCVLMVETIYLYLVDFFVWILDIPPIRLNIFYLYEFII